ncbi:MAG: DUF1330 domain-containing protein [Myxococcota bacterium]
MADDRIFMLNALWFRKDGGAEKYAEYGRAAAPFVSALGGRMVTAYQPDMALIGDWKPDLLFFVEWPSWEAFSRLPNDPGYKKVAHLREEALERSLLIRCREAYSRSDSS